MQKYANLVELEKCCQTHIFLQNFVLIQPRTSAPKICKLFSMRRLLLARRSMKLLWDELDDDGSGFIEMKELDPEAAEGPRMLLGAFWQGLAELRKFG